MSLREKWLFGYFWIISTSRIRAFNKLSEALQLLDSGLSQYIILVALHQSSSSNSHCKLKSMKVPSDLPLDRTIFLLIAHREWPNFCSQRLWNGKGRPEKLWSLQSLSTSCGLLRWPPQGQATFGQNVSLNPYSNQNICCCLFHIVPLIIVNGAKHCTVSEIQDLHPCKTYCTCPFC